MTQKSIPGWAAGWPLFEIRAPTVTLLYPESLNRGVMVWLSSSVTVAGRSATFLLTTASGIGGPSTALAKINTVSLAPTRSRKAGASATLTVNAPAVVVSAAGPESLAQA